MYEYQVKKLKKYRGKKKMIVFGKEYEVSDSGFITLESETQYKFCSSVKEFWNWYYENEVHDPDSMTFVFYNDGTQWCSDDSDDPPRKTGIASAVSSNGWGYVCYNCKPKRTYFSDDDSDYIDDVEMN